MGKKSFIIHTDSLAVLDKLTDEQAGKLFKAIKDYHAEILVELDILTEIAFVPFRNQFERDKETYSHVIKRNRVNGSKGGRPQKPKKPSRFSENPEKPKKTQRNPKNLDSDSDNVSDSVNKNDSESDSERNTAKTPLEAKFFEFVKFRKAKRQPILEESMQAFKNKLWKLSKQNEQTAIEILEQSIANGWTGIFELKEQTNGSKKRINSHLVDDLRKDVISYVADRFGKNPDE